MMSNRDTSKSPHPNIRERYFDSQSYLPQNPYDTPLPGNYYSYPSGYEFEHGPQEYGANRFGQATYHHHVYSTIPDGGGRYGGGGGGSGGGHKSKSSALLMSALTLLAFLFFINMLQTCLKEQMTSLNPTVMVMTAGTSRFRKTGTAGNTIDSNKDIGMNDQHDAGAGVISTSISDNLDLITNDQGDVFYAAAPKISLKLDDDPIQIRNSDTTWEEIKQRN